MITHLEVLTLRTFHQRWCGVKKFSVLEKPLYIPRCRAIHTFGVSFPLHLLWVSRTGKLLRLDKSVPKNRIKWCPEASGVIEIRTELGIPNYKKGHRFCLKGQALVEAAFVMPVLFLLLFGFIELGLLLHAQQKLTYVAQYATQVGSLTNNDIKITGAVESFYQPTSLSVAMQNTDMATNTSIASSSRRYNDLLAVQLTFPYQLHIPFWPVEVFDLNAQGSARVLCQSSTPPYQCD